jgi:hypothetical protein
MTILTSIASYLLVSETFFSSSKTLKACGTIVKRNTSDEAATSMPQQFGPNQAQGVIIRSNSR